MKFFLIQLLRLVSILIFVSGALTVIVIVLASRKAGVYYRDPHFWEHVLYIGLIFFIAVMAIAVGRKGFIYSGSKLIEYRSKKYKKYDNNNSLHNSEGNPNSLDYLPKNIVLYLRCFQDDNVTSNTIEAEQINNISIPGIRTIEEQISAAFKIAGEIFALDDPLSVLPSPGALKFKEADENWKRTIWLLMEKANAIIFLLGDSESFWWEVENAFENSFHNKLVILIPGNRQLMENFAGKIHKITGHDITNLLPKESSNYIIDSALYFENGKEPKLIPVQSIKINRENNLMPLTPKLRVALKPFFSQLGIKWLPPSLPYNAYRDILITSWVTFLSVFVSIRDNMWDFKFLDHSPLFGIFLILFFIGSIVSFLVTMNRYFFQPYVNGKY